MCSAAFHFSDWSRILSGAPIEERAYNGLRTLQFPRIYYKSHPKFTKKTRKSKKVEKWILSFLAFVSLLDEYVRMR